MANLTGKVAIVTGAWGMRNIGNSSAVRLAKDGCRVVVSDIRRPADRIPEDERAAGWRGIESVVDVIEKQGGAAKAVYCDITKDAEIEALVQETVKAYGRVDILVNGARAFTEGNPLLQMRREVWDWQMTVNVSGPLMCTKYVANEMIREGHGGSIINVSSATGKKPGTGVYGVTKATLNFLTTMCALDLIKYGIRVNAVCPGIIFTNRWNPGDAKRAQELGITYDSYRQQWAKERVKDVPIGRLGEPEDVADVIAFLASEDSRYMVGSCVDINGGWYMPPP